MKSSIVVSVTIAGLSILVCACEENDPPLVFDQTYSISENSRTGIVGGAGSNNHFNGVMDEMRIYNRPLTEAEIALLNTEI